MLKRYATYAAFVFALFGIVLAARWLGGRVAHGQEIALTKPISRFVTFESTFTVTSASDAPSSPPIRGFEGVRSDGAYVLGRYMPRPDNRTYLLRRILYPATGLNIVVMDDIRARTTTYLPAGHSDRTGSVLPDPTSNCLALRGRDHGRVLPTGTYTGSELLMGYPVVMVSLDKRPMRSGMNLKTTNWLAPSLDCQVLRSLWEVTDDAGNLITSTDRRVTNVVMGEPSGVLFDVPPGWTERGPTSSEEEYLRIFKNGQVNPDLHMNFARQEKVYLERHK
jgi:hypothetical protein